MNTILSFMDKIYSKEQYIKDKERWINLGLEYPQIKLLRQGREMGLNDKYIQLCEKKEYSEYVLPRKISENLLKQRLL